MDVNIGKLNKRVEIVRISTSPDADGYADPTETVIRRPWAQFSRVSGSEALRQGADMGDVKVRFLIRSDIRPSAGRTGCGTTARTTRSSTSTTTATAASIQS